MSTTPTQQQEQQFVVQQCYLEGDTPQQANDRGAAIITRATEIMQQGHYGWSWALAKAKEELGKTNGRAADS